MLCFFYTDCIMFLSQKASVAVLYATLNNNSAVAGTLVQGVVHLTVEQESVECSSIDFSVHGKETTDYFAGGDGQGSSSESVTVLSINQVLVHFPSGRIARGQYEYPLTFAIPASVPPTMSASHSPFLSSGESRRCEVSYRLHVQLNRPGIMRWNIEFWEPITVVRAVPTQSFEMKVIPPVKVNVCTLGCYDRGHVVISGTLEPGVLCPGRNAKLKYAVINGSTAHIKAIEICLDETIKYKTNSHTTKASICLYKKRLKSGEARLNLHPIVCQKGRAPDQQDLDKLRQILEGSEAELTFIVPCTARHTFRSTLISVTHTLSVSVVTAFGTMNPKVLLDIEVYNHGGTLPPEVAAPGARAMTNMVSAAPAMGAMTNMVSAAPGMGAMPTMVNAAPAMGAMPTMVSVPPGMAAVPTMMSVPPGMGAMPTMVSVPPGMGAMPTMMSVPPGMVAVPTMVSVPSGLGGIPTMRSVRNSQVAPAYVAISPARPDAAGGAGVQMAARVVPY